MAKKSCGLQPHYSLQFSKMAIEAKENNQGMREVRCALRPGLSEIFHRSPKRKIPEAGSTFGRLFLRLTP